MDQNMQSPPYPENGGKGKAWKIAALVVLLLCALPVLIPVSLCAAGGVLVVALCVAGAALAAVMCVAGGVFGLGVCVLAGLICLAALQIAALAGVGFGAVMLFQTPASGMAVLGANLFLTGALMLFWIALWQLLRLLSRGLCALVNWIRRTFFSGGRRKPEQKCFRQAEACDPGRKTGEGGTGDAESAEGRQGS